MANRKSPSSETATDGHEESVSPDGKAASAELTDDTSSERAADNSDDVGDGSDTNVSKQSDDAGPGEEASEQPDDTAPESENAPAALDEMHDDAASAPVAATPSTMDHPEPARGGPGFVPLVLGGLVAGAIGFGGGYFFDLNSTGQIADLSGSVETQGAQLSTLSERAEALETNIAALAPPEVDLSAVEGAIGDLATQLDEVAANLTNIDERLGEVEARPVFSGDAGADEAAIAAAIEQLRDDLLAQQAENQVLAEDIQAMAEDAANRISEAEARAEASAETATAQANISELRIAVAAGSPFAEPLAAVAEAHGLSLPEAITAVAETGVPTLAEIEAAFPAAARAALPVALQANAGETAGDRLGAFLRSQVGGRSLEPQSGDDPDAVISRAGASVTSGNLTTALEELSALPDPAVEVMADWIELAASRISALEALDGLAAELGN